MSSTERDLREAGNHFDDVLSKIYYAPSLKGSFSGSQSLFDSAKMLIPKVRLKDVKNFLSKQNTYTDYRYVKKRFPTRKYKAGFTDAIWAIDLVFIREYQKYNSKEYILTIVDMFSR